MMNKIQMEEKRTRDNNHVLRHTACHWLCLLLSLEPMQNWLPRKRQMLYRKSRIFAVRGINAICVVLFPLCVDDEQTPRVFAAASVNFFVIWLGSDK